ncbi:carbohydrate-binding protein [Thalassotalea litorea]|uniref:carbohydrate-binding protein n=1 Tax=Thalassotalea litorea TaxID=2020715 RepID=UPI0037370087
MKTKCLNKSGKFARWLMITSTLMMGLGFISNAQAQRGRLHIDQSLGHNIILTDQNTTLRGVSLSFDGGDPYGSIEPIMPSQESFNKLASEYGFNFVHVYLEGDAGQNPDPVGVNLALADELVARTKQANLYVMITIANNGENGQIHSMQKTLDFWSLYAPRYKDETHVLYEAHNEPVAGQNHAWSDADWDKQVQMYNHIRSLAPDTMIFLGSFMSFNGADAAMYGADYIKSNVGDPNIWENAAFAWHGYWDLPGIESTINPIRAAGTGYPGLLCTEFWPGDTENGYNAAFESHHMGWAQFQWLNAQDMDLDNLRNKLNNAGTVWKPELSATSWPTAGAPNVPAMGTRIGIYSHFEGKFVNISGSNMAVAADAFTDGPNDSFTLVDAGNGHVALQTDSGTYVSATGDGQPLTTTATSIGVNEMWQWMQLCPDENVPAMTLRPWGGDGHLIGKLGRGRNAGLLSANADDASYDGVAEYGFVTAATNQAPQGCEPPAPPAPGPFYGVPMPVPTDPSQPHPFNSSAPKNVIYASDFDYGGEGVAYHDIDDENWGGAYRWDVGVDIEATDGFTNVGWIDPGEWLNYAIDVQTAGTYVLTMRVASAQDNGQFHIEIDGVNITGPVITPNTGAWNTYQDMQTEVTFEAGVQIMTMVSAGGFNLISYDLQPGTVTPPEQGTEVSVGDITMGWSSANGNRITVYSTTTIVDELGSPMEGVTVTGQWSGLSSGTVSGVTNQSGQVTLSSATVRDPKGTFTFTVTDVQGSLPYNAAANATNSGNVTF